MRLSTIYLPFCCFFFLAFGLKARAQQIDSLLALQQLADPQEKIFVHFDKNYYNPGETIWFKAYIYSGVLPSERSRNFYAELRDEKGVLIDKKTAPVMFASAYSQFELPDSFPKTAVYFRAYTTNMLNSDTAFIYTKPIKIIHPAKKAAPKATAAAPPTIKFLPEGGDWIAGIEANMAFAAVDANDDPVTCTGVIMSSDGKEVASFASVHDGMGSFLITPEAGKTYTATWKDEKGKEYKATLPPVASNGISLKITDEKTAKRFTVTRREDAPAALQALTIIGVFNKQLVYQAKINLPNKTSASAPMPVNQLTSGILQVTVFDQQMKPVAERICFVNNGSFEFDADAWISDINTSKRGLNRAEVKIGDTTAANLSLSITDADLNVPETKFRDNLVTHMLFTGELRGKVNEPYYYFYSTSDSTPYYLDLVMLTHGWRRYNWDNVLAANFPKPRFEETDYLALKGKVINRVGSAFEPNLALNGFILTTDSSNSFVSLPVARDGSVLQDGIIFYDSARLFLQFSNKNRDFEPSLLNLNNGLLQGDPAGEIKGDLGKTPYGPDSLLLAKNAAINSEALKVAAKKFKDAHELENVTVVAKAKTNLEKLDEEYTSGMFSGDARGFDLETDPTAAGSQNIFQYLQGRVAGLQINTNTNPASLTWRGGTPVVYLNEMQVDAQQIQSVNVADIAYVKVFNPASAGVIRSNGGGVIAVYTKKGGSNNANVPSKLGQLILNGYSAVKQFYASDISTESGDAFYDKLNTTLYWNPNIVLNKTDKRLRIQFFNNDFSTSFRIVLEGINQDGKLIHIEKVVSKN